MYLLNPFFSLLILISSLLTLCACQFESKSPSFAIEEVLPKIPSLDGEIYVIGQGFSDQMGVISLNGRPLELISWRDQQIQAKIPKDASSGHGFLVVQTNGLNSAPFALYVTGEVFNRDFGVTFQDQRIRTDLGINDQAIDFLVTDQNLSNYDLKILNQANANVLFVPKINVDNRLVLEIHLQNIEANPWGMAFHLKYESSRLKLIEESQHIPLLAADPKQMKMVKEVKPGHLMLMAMYPEPIAFQLTFDILQEGEMLFEIPIRGRMFKDQQKQSKQLIWDQGTLILKTKAE